METGVLTVQGMLCDFAEVSGGKLFIAGAGINLIATNAAEAPHPVNISLALLVKIPWGATNQQHKLRIQLVSDSAGKVPETIEINSLLPPNSPEEDRGSIVAFFNAGRSPNMQVGEESLLPIAIPLFGLPLPNVGSYFFQISIDGTDVDRVSFRVTTVLDLSGMGARSQF